MRRLAPHRLSPLEHPFRFVLERVGDDRERGYSLGRELVAVWPAAQLLLAVRRIEPREAHLRDLRERERPGELPVELPRLVRCDETLILLRDVHEDLPFSAQRPPSTAIRAPTRRPCASSQPVREECVPNPHGPIMPLPAANVYGTTALRPSSATPPTRARRRGRSGHTGPKAHAG